MKLNRWLGVTLLAVLCTKAGFSQQLRLGNNPYTVEKSAVLELQSANQGLLFTRIADTALINVLNPPDGMVIYFNPTKQLMLRANGYWKSFVTSVDTGSIANFSQKVRSLFSASAPITLNNGQIGITQASGSTNGYLSSTDWTTFNNKLSSVDTGSISNFFLKTRSELSAGTGISYNNTTGVISNSGVTSVNGNTGALTMDTTFISNFYSKVRSLFSAGTGVSYNSATGVITATGGAGGSSWALGGNTVGSEKKFGTIDGYDLPFITTNTEQMRLTKTGNLGIGTSSFDAVAPEKLLIDAGVTSSYNLLIAQGERNGYLQFNITNNSTGGQASTDIVATANNGTETTNYVDLGMNGGGYNSANNILSGPDNGYLYSAGNDFIIGNSSPAKDLILFTGGITTSNERMRITSAGNIGVGTSSPSEVMDISGNLKFSGALMPGGNAGTSGYILQSNGTGSAPTWVAGPSNTAWQLDGNSVSAIKNLGTISNYSLPFITNNVERMRIANTGNIGIGTSAFDATNPEKLLINAGATSSFNLINAKGTINNYLQLNIQNLSAGASASSDVVATANDGDETSNFIDMGVNSSGYSSTGILGGAHNAYLYSTGNDFVIGNQTANKNLLFFTGGNGTANERMRIDGSGRVGIGVTNPANPLVVKDTLEIRRTGTLSELLFSNTAGYGDFRIGGDGGDIFWQGGGGRNLQMGSYWTTILSGDRETSAFPSFSSGTANTGVLVLGQRDASVPLAIQGNSATQSANLTEWRNSSGTVLDVVDANGNVGVGASSFDATNPEQLLVDAGTTNSFNVISGKGSINSYLQLNIQNRSSGTSASSDVVATADNGNESINFVDLGINSSTYSNSGVLGGR